VEGSSDEQKQHCMVTLAAHSAREAAVAVKLAEAASAVAERAPSDTIGLSGTQGQEVAVPSTVHPRRGKGATVVAAAATAIAEKGALPADMLSLAMLRAVSARTSALAAAAAVEEAASIGDASQLTGLALRHIIGAFQLDEAAVAVNGVLFAIKTDLALLLISLSY
jgi:hypothetical protein